MRKFLLIPHVLYILMAICLLVSPSALAADRQNLRVGYTNIPGYLSKDSLGFYKGLIYQYLEAVADYMRADLRYTEGTLADNLDKLANGELDLVPTKDQHETAQLTSIPLSPSIGYAVIRRSDSELYGSQLQSAIASLDKVNPFFRLHLLEKYSPVSSQSLVLTPEEKSFLNDHGPLRILVDDTQEPYSYADEQGNIKGIIPEIMQLFASELGTEIEFITYDVQGLGVEALHNDKADLIASFYSDYNWADTNDMDITFPYITLEYVPIMRKDKALPERPTVACPRGYFFSYDWIGRLFPSEQVRYYNSMNECLTAVRKGEADIVLTRAFTAQNDIVSHGYYNLYTNGTVLFHHQVCLAMNKSADPRLLSILNKAVMRLDATKLESIITSNTFELRQKDSIMAFLYRNPLKSLGIMGSIALVAILCMAGFIFQKRRYTETMYELAHTNSVTGMRNLRWFHSKLGKLVDAHAASRKEGRLYIMVITVDRIAFLKENYDLTILIQSLLAKIKLIREHNPWLLVDAVNSEVTSIYVLCEEPDGKTILQAVEKLTRDGCIIPIGSLEMNFTYRVGLAPVPKRGDINSQLLLSNAQTALTEAIAKGRNIELYNESMSRRNLRQQQMEDYMHKALANDEFKVWLQPKYDLASHRTIGAEALVRWDSPELGFLMPGAFIDLFERNGFAVELDYYMLEKTCEMQMNRLKAGLPIIPISVNQSGLHITEKDYIKRMRGIVDKWKLPAGTIELEITETAFVDFTTKEQRNEAAIIIDHLQEIGFSLSMDDFCTGYSSLSMLQNLPMNVMKIDRSILLASETSLRALRILRHVIDLGKALGMRILTEGIETEEQEKLLLSLGCDLGQGYLFAQPMSARDFFEDFLPKHM